MVSSKKNKTTTATKKKKTASVSAAPAIKVSLDPPSKRQDRRGFELIFVGSAAVGLYALYKLTTAFAASTTIGNVVLASLLWLAVIVGVVLTVYVTDQSTRPPENDVYSFLQFQKKRQQTDGGNASKESTRPPVLVCLGDSLTHGKASSNWVDRVLPSVLTKLTAGPSTDTNGTNNKDRDSDTSTGTTQSRPSPWTHKDPLWVVNCGQNNVVSEVGLQERVGWALSCQPDAVVVLLGTNDSRALIERGWKNQLEFMWWTKEKLSLDVLEHNLDRTVETLLSQHKQTQQSSSSGGSNNKKTKSRSSSTIRVALCTLPPMSEDLNSVANHIVRLANQRIAAVAAKHHHRNCTLLDVYGAMEGQIREQTSTRLPVGTVTLLAPLVGFCHYVCGYSFQTIASYIGHVVLLDCLHLNDVGGDLVKDLVVDFVTDKVLAESGSTKKTQ